MNTGFERIHQQVYDVISSLINAKSPLDLLFALSGGVDSCVLLHALIQVKKSLEFNFRVMHVHHGLSPNAENWAEFCKQTCQTYQVPLDVLKVEVQMGAGIGLEASAREARYKALYGAHADYIILAHHQDDQAETLLLQLFRGAGLKGLSAMAAHDENRSLLRPLLDITRQEIEAYAKANNLAWINDESNLDTKYDRNYCRHEIMPVIKARFPASGETLARSASHIAEASELLNELAQIDANTCLIEGQMSIKQLRELSLPRSKNLFRWWLSCMGFLAPSSDRLDDMLTQLMNASQDAMIKISIDSANEIILRRYQGFAYIDTNYSEQTNDIAMIWQGESTLIMPDGTHLVFERHQGQGLAIDKLGGHKLRISSRKGGERFKPDFARPTRTLKHLLQEANLPPWQRERLPLVYLDDALAVVPNIGVDCMMQASERDVGLVIRWIT